MPNSAECYRTICLERYISARLTCITIYRSCISFVFIIIKAQARTTDSYVFVDTAVIIYVDYANTIVEKKTD